MYRLILLSTLLASNSVAAQTGSSPLPGAACSRGTHYTTIRHNLIKLGQFGAFQQAVAAHNAWYVSHHSATHTALVRVLGHGGGLADDEAVTVTTYAETALPPHDAGYEAFTAKYKAVSEIKDEARVCMP